MAVSTGRVVGADAPALRELSRRFEQGAERLELLTTSLRSRLHTAPWRGQRADAYRRAFDSRHAPQLRSSAAALRQAAVGLRQQADQQDGAASAASGALGATSVPASSSGGQHGGGQDLSAALGTLALDLLSVAGLAGNIEATLVSLKALVDASKGPVDWNGLKIYGKLATRSLVALSILQDLVELGRGALEGDEDEVAYNALQLAVTAATIALAPTCPPAAIVVGAVGVGLALGEDTLKPYASEAATTVLRINASRVVAGPVVAFDMGWGAAQVAQGRPVDDVARAVAGRLEGRARWMLGFDEWKRALG